MTGRSNFQPLQGAMTFHCIRKEPADNISRNAFSEKAKETKIYLKKKIKKKNIYLYIYINLII